MTTSLPVLLVGSVPGQSTQSIIEMIGRGVGDLVLSLPDGEPLPRLGWIHFVAAKTFHGHPQLETIQTPPPVDPSDPTEWRTAQMYFLPRSTQDYYLFKVRPGCPEVQINDLGYAREIGASYPIFKQLRDRGVIPKHVRFQIAMPSTETCVRHFVTTEADYDVLAAAYERALVREVEALTRVVPPHDLAIQFDVLLEVIIADRGEQFDVASPIYEGLKGLRLTSDHRARFQRFVQNVCAKIPREVRLGLHLCYGDLGHTHIVEPADLATVTRLASEAQRLAKRRIDYFHMPVPRGRKDDAYFAPLQDIEVDPDCIVYLGLIHLTDGVDGALARIKCARKYLPKFGIATECGFGERDAKTVPALLQLHRDVAAAATRVK